MTDEERDSVRRKPDVTLHWENESRRTTAFRRGPNLKIMFKWLQLEYLIMLGGYFLYRNQPARALDYYRRITILNPQLAFGFARVGYCLAALRRYDEAIGPYDKALQLSPDYGKVHAHLGLALYHLGEYLRSAESLERGFRLQPKLVQGRRARFWRYRLGISYAMLHDVSAATRNFQLSLDAMLKTRRLLFFRRDEKRSVPSEGELYYQLGCAYYNGERYKEAIEVLQKAVRLNSGHDDIFYKLGLAFSQLGEYQTALGHLEKARSISPTRGDIHYALGVVLGELKQTERAVQAYQEAVKYRPDDAASYFNLGVVYGKLGCFEDEKAAYQRAIALDPKDIQAQINLGAAYFRELENEKSLLTYQSALQSDPDNALALYGLARCYSNLDQYPSAIAAFKRAITLKPDFGVAYEYLGLTYFQMGQLDEAIDNLKRSVQISPMNSAIHEDLGAVYEKAGRSDLAEKEFAKCRELENQCSSNSASQND
jgi:tetratricopeptide (TPR) repeat protein